MSVRRPVPPAAVPRPGPPQSSTQPCSAAARANSSSAPSTCPSGPRTGTGNGGSACAPGQPAQRPPHPAGPLRAHLSRWPIGDPQAGTGRLQRWRRQPVICRRCRYRSPLLGLGQRLADRLLVPPGHRPTPAAADPRHRRSHTTCRRRLLVDMHQVGQHVQVRDLTRGRCDPSRSHRLPHHRSSVSSTSDNPPTRAPAPQLRQKPPGLRPGSGAGLRPALCWPLRGPAYHGPALTGPWPAPNRATG